MAKAKIRARKFRATGKKHKHNKVSVAERKRIKRLEARRQREQAKANISQETV